MIRTSQVVVTGMGAVSALGHDCTALQAAIEAGRSGIGRIRRFSTDGFDVHSAAEVQDWPGACPGPAEASDERLCVDFSLRAAREALDQARLTTLPAASRSALVFGTALGNLQCPVHELAEEMAGALGLAGPTLTVCTACSSSSGAIGLGRDLLLNGEADVVVAGGADVLTAKVFAGFHALGVLSPSKCAPFSSPFGTSLGEGAGFLVIERLQDAERRGVEPLAFLSGYGLSGDGYHETSPHPAGRGVEAAVRAALVEAGLGAADVGYVNAHGSGTESNDRAEWQGIQRGLDGRSNVPVSSTKGAIGHAQGGAGALEIIVTILMMRRDLLPPTFNFIGPRQFAPDDPIGETRPRPGRFDHAVSVNAAFGGANTAVVVSRVPSVQLRSRERAAVHVLGMGMVGRCGIGVEAWDRRAPGPSDGRLASFNLAEVSRRLDPRGLDRSARYLTAAAALALGEAEQASVVRNRPDVGLVVGSTRLSPESLRDFGRSATEFGLPRVSAPAFARIVLNAPAGFCSKLLSLRGPLSVITVGAGSGLAAILVAIDLLSRRDDVRMMLGAAVDELADTEDPAHTMPAGEGAVCVALTRAGREAWATRVPRVCGWGFAGPTRLPEAVTRARAGDRHASREIDAIFDERDYAGSAAQGWALPSALAFVAAVTALRRGDVRRALVTSDLGRSVSAAVLLEA